ncbi:Hypothetical_protein [Hexamita inflata]|uniref:Hypothetical_protein n=1 Tax=Hexamita inflata TaxID=28002 RepID=A0ABP1J4L0_9EUKA
MLDMGQFIQSPKGVQTFKQQYQNHQVLVDYLRKTCYQDSKELTLLNSTFSMQQASFNPIYLQHVQICCVQVECNGGAVASEQLAITEIRSCIFEFFAQHSDSEYQYVRELDRRESSESCLPDYQPVQFVADPANQLGAISGAEHLGFERICSVANNSIGSG